MGLLDWYREARGRREKYRADRAMQEDVIDEMDRILSEVKSKIPLVRKYRQRLLPSVQSALVTVNNMVSLIPGPVALGPTHRETTTILKLLFTSEEDLSQWLKRCRKLVDAFKSANTETIFAILSAGYKEKTVFGMKQHGEILQRDVMYRTPVFTHPEILIAAREMDLARDELKHRIMVMLFIRALDEIQDLKSRRGELEHLHDLLEFKLGEKYDTAHDEYADENPKETKAVLHSIEEKLDHMGLDTLDTPDDHLAHVINALIAISDHLQIKESKIAINDQGFLVDRGTTTTEKEIQFAECAYAGKEKRALILTRIERKWFDWVIE